MKALTAIRNGAGDDDPVFGMSESTIAHRVRSAAAAADLGDSCSGRSVMRGIGPAHDSRRRKRPVSRPFD